MKKTIYLVILWLGSTIFISACSTPEQKPKGEYATGIFIVNEGNFSESNGDISFYDEATSTVTQDIFNKANGVSTGGIIQSVYFYKNFAFIIDQLGNRIEVVEAATFKSIATIEEGLSTPRYMVVANNKGYVSNWGSFDNNFDLPDSYVAVIDLSSYTVTKSIDIGNGAEGLLEYGGSVYVADSYANTIESIDPNTDTVKESITVADSPVGFAEDKNGKVWVLSSSFLSGSALSQLDLASSRVLKTFSVGASAKSLTINNAGDQLYYLSTPYGANAQVRTVSIDASSDATEALITAANLYGLGVDPGTGIIYLGNHNGFQGNGTVLRYDGATLLDNFPVGIAPNGFIFRK